MRKHRVITTAALLGLALPTTASAGSLLSGYGGPGQGSQAILGATIIGGGSSGSGSAGGGGSSPGSETATGGTLQVIAPKAKTRSGPGGKAQHPAKARTDGGRASASPSGAHRATSTLSATETATVTTPPLGISGTDLVFIVLAFGALVLTAAITGRLVRRSQ